MILLVDFSLIYFTTFFEWTAHVFLEWETALKRNQQRNQHSLFISTSKFPIYRNGGIVGSLIGPIKPIKYQPVIQMTDR